MFTAPCIFAAITLHKIAEKKWIHLKTSSSYTYHGTYFFKIITALAPNPYYLKRRYSFFTRAYNYYNNNKSIFHFV